MEVYLLKLALQCSRGIWGYDKTTVLKGVTSTLYMVETDNDKLLFWNSSNSGVFNIKDTLDKISSLLEEGTISGSVSVDMVEIMFEVFEK